MEIIRDLRLGVFDVLIGINLLREGLDLPEVSLVAILDADKEGFLRSERSLIQTIGRAARNASGLAILYGDKITRSMQASIDVTEARRHKQHAYNEAHGITPTTIKKNVMDALGGVFAGDTDQSRVTAKVDKVLVGANLAAHLEALRKDMRKAAENLEFEEAARLRAEVHRLEAVELAVVDDPLARQAAVGAAWAGAGSAAAAAAFAAAAAAAFSVASAAALVAASFAAFAATFSAASAAASAAATGSSPFFSAALAAFVAASSCSWISLGSSCRSAFSVFHGSAGESPSKTACREPGSGGVYFGCLPLRRALRA